MKSKLFCCCAFLALTTSAVAADRIEPLPKQLEGVGINEHLDRPIPLQLTFRDEHDQQVTLGQYFKPKKPVIITLNYSECKLLCSLQLDGLVKSLQAMRWAPGKEFEIVTVSINPQEGATSAAKAQHNYIEKLGKPEAAAGWHFLTGKEENIRALADAIGFGYQFDPIQKQFAHTAALFLITPEGHISRYLYGIDYDPRTLQLSLTEAAEGGVGGAVASNMYDRVVLSCYKYDSQSGNYVFQAIMIMRAGGILTALVVGLWLGWTWLRHPRRRPAPLENPLT